MATRIAVLADLHLSPISGTAQDAVLEWAVSLLRADPPDVVVVVGDMTADGSYASAKRLRDTLDRARLNLRMTPGNSDRRTAGDWSRVHHLVSLPGAFVSEDCVVVLFDTSGGRVPKGDRRRVERWLGDADTDAHRGQAETETARLCAAEPRDGPGGPRGGRRIVLATHVHPGGLRRKSRAWLEAVLKDRRVDFLIAGHRHRDSSPGPGRLPVHVVRGLDPDKAVGGPPAVAFFQRDGSTWSRHDIPFAAGDPATWPGADRGELASFLGLSCMDDTLGGLAFARDEGIPFVELRAPAALNAPSAALAEASASWRLAGGQGLSLHMPDMALRAGGFADGEARLWRRSLHLAESLGADRLTVHAPRVSVGRMQPRTGPWNALVDAYVLLLRPAVSRGMCIGIENLHMRRGVEIDDGRRGFGYLPEECLSWIRDLRRGADYERIGLLLDIGHARNNAPFSKRVTLAQWYALTGGLTVGYHVHQVRESRRGMANHAPITGPFGPLVSLSSFFWAWQAGQLRRGPVFVEVRGADRCRASFAVLRSLCRDGASGADSAQG